MTGVAPGVRLWQAGRRNALGVGYYILHFAGTVANAIQILTAGRPTTDGLVIAGFIVCAALLPFAYQLGRGRMGGEIAALTGERDMHVEELRHTRILLEGTLGAYRPYDD